MNNLPIGLRSDILFFNFRNNVIEKNDYIVLYTLNNLDFFWGNYLILKNPLSIGDFEKWTKYYQNEFSNISSNKQMCFSWPGDLSYIELNKFKENNFIFFDRLTMTARKKDIKCKYYNNEVLCKRMVTNDDWEQVLNFQFKINEFLNKKKSKSYIEKRVFEFKSYTDNNHGYWYAAFLNGEIISDVGLYWNDEFARLQNLKTLKEYRKLGVAQTLIKYAIEDSNQEFFTLEAEENGLAINMYKSIGFTVQEKKYGLYSSSI
ncbi:N-acetyltransferase [Pigmentibacter sp. JX0631]|uniref:GNAT family N-acetyltransferase n=1 Tax=Pigmentibacter sp. JX0631 TaxID=2976982 RepID=UPI0024686AFC|nr:N-acetyltransferase [Pigmentibacter sp. JX0631]WGL61226.1 N-acetyltransferase [Pigmentibacter sp. JX0631]